MFVRYSIFTTLLLSFAVASNAGKLGLVTSDVSLGDDGDQDNEGRGHRKDKDHHDGFGCMEKGMKCKGGYKPGMGGVMHCDGGIKAEMYGKSDDMTSELEGHVKGQMEDFVMNDKFLFKPDDETMQALEAFDDESFVEGLEEGAEKSIEFGGFMLAHFGCKMTFKKTKLGLKKSAECGGTFSKGHGKKPGEKELEYNFFE